MSKKTKISGKTYSRSKFIGWKYEYKLIVYVDGDEFLFYIYTDCSDINEIREHTSAFVKNNRKYKVFDLLEKEYIEKEVKMLDKFLKSL